MIQTPEFRPVVHEDSSCGSVVLATVLEISTQEADMWMDLAAKKGWNGYTNVSHIRAVCENNNIKMNPLKLIDKKKKPLKLNYVNKPTALFIQMRGPWESKGWRSSYSNTHWALQFRDQVMDINNIYEEAHQRLPIWVHKDVWDLETMNFLVEEMDDCIGYNIRNAYEFVEEL